MNDLRPLEAIKYYYGQVLSGTQDILTSACCSAEAMPAHIRPLLAEIHPEVKDRFYGCGSPFPPALEGRTVLDLGSGAGRDVYLMSRLVGPTGRVIGVDMTDEQLEVARRHIDYHTGVFGYSSPNVEFRTGYIEDLASAGIEDASVDLVVSNCVMNLSPDKPRAFSELFRVLKPGGELYFSDVYVDRRLDPALRDDPVLLGECLAGAMYREDFRRLMAELGCRDFRVIASTPITVGNPELEARLGLANFQSTTIRAFKLDLEDRCEDYGQVAWYRGGIAGHPHAFVLDDHHRFEIHRPMLVCGNTADMVSQTRYAPYFEVRGDKRVHLGAFDCSTPQTAPAVGLSAGTQAAPGLSEASGACVPGSGCC